MLRKIAIALAAPAVLIGLAATAGAASASTISHSPTHVNQTVTTLHSSFGSEACYKAEDKLVLADRKVTEIASDISRLSSYRHNPAVQREIWAYQEQLRADQAAVTADKNAEQRECTPVRYPVYNTRW
jgi:hypothetical protein